VLIAAAYLHDIGYATTLQRTGAHQLDGAFFVKGLGHHRLSALVAHHSQAKFEVQLRGLADELAQFDDEQSTVSDALTFCDMVSALPVTRSPSTSDWVKSRRGMSQVAWL
jgi:hypothetical protein